MRRVALEIVKHSKSSWLKKMVNFCREFGWQEMGAEQVKGMSEAEVKGMLESVAWRKVKEEWSKDLEKKPKLSMMKNIIKCGEESSCADVKSKRAGRVMLKLRECSSGEVEDVTHWLLRCPAWSSLRQPLLILVQPNTEENEQAALLLSWACRSRSILTNIMSMWDAHFAAIVRTPTHVTIMSYTITCNQYSGSLCRISIHLIAFHLIMTSPHIRTYICFTSLYCIVLCWTILSPSANCGTVHFRKKWTRPFFTLETS